ncbi:hypothetical protein IAT38_004489 [Cryptococcus sp. DSM 104549]
MPKPTFLQTVLRKPARSYADPNGGSPWADSYVDERQSHYYPQSRYVPAPRSEYGYDYPESSASYSMYREDVGPGPSSGRRAGGSVGGRKGAGSTVSASAASEIGAGTRFPKATRRVASSVVLRDGGLVHQPLRETASAVGVGSAVGAPRRKKERSETEAQKLAAATQAETSRASTVKRKKKKKVVRSALAGDDGTSSVVSSPVSPVSHVSLSTTMSLSHPPPIRSRQSETSSSAASSPVPPLSPTVPVQQRIVVDQAPPTRPAMAVLSKGPMPLLTPPSSVQSTPMSSTTSVIRRQVTVPPIIVEKVKPVVEESDDEDEVFYTPRSSMDLTPTLREPLLAEPVLTPKAVSRTPPVEPPSFNFLPPTPAPVPDPIQSPFYSEPPSPVDSSLHPNRLPPRPSPRITIPSPPAAPAPPPLELAPPVPPKDDVEIQSASGEVGSDEDEESERQGYRGRSTGTSPSRLSRPPSITPTSRPTSRAQSFSRSHSARSPSIDDRATLSRQSTRHLSRGSHDGSRPGSEASFGATSAREGSIRGSTSGFGKGGWAAAAASASAARSAAGSPVMMYMPSQGDGWADFQQPPPRQSRFTPLPAASAPLSFDRLVNGSSMGGTSSAPTSQNGHSQAQGYGGQVPGPMQGQGSLRPPSNADSSPSEYSQISDGLPVPSRSYLKEDYTSQASQSSQLSDDGQGGAGETGWGEENGVGQEWRDERGGRRSISPAGVVPFPEARLPSLAPVATTSSSSRPTSPRPLSPQPYLSRPSSPLPAQPNCRVHSPIPTRPTTPSSRAGFEPPSFLDPDILTLLPEMTPEDSERTYRPSPADPPRSKSRLSLHDHVGHSRRSSMFRARSEVGLGGLGSGNSEAGEEGDGLGELPSAPVVRRSKSVIGFRHTGGSAGSKWEGSSHGDGVLMESHGRAQDGTGGYTNLILPSGAYKPSNPSRFTPDLDARILGLPHATMASITLHTTFHRSSATPVHLRDQLPPLVDFTSHLKPPVKVGNSQLLVQVYAVAVDQVDVRALEDKGRGDVGKWVPGRSFVGRALVVGADEKEVVRGDIVMGLLDIRKSGALSEYIIVERRRISRAPFPTPLTLEQLAILPLQGIAAARAVRTNLTRHTRALVMNAHTGVAALVCQEMARAGVNVTAVVPGGDDSHEAHRRCLTNGAKGVLMGSAAAVMINLEESGWDYVFDTQGGQRVYDTARRMLKDGGKIVSMKRPESNFSHGAPILASRPSGIKTLRSVFSNKRKESKFVAFEYLPPTGSGEPEVDSSGMDYRDVMEEPCMAIFRPALEGEKSVMPFEKGAEVFGYGGWGECGVRVVRVMG